MAQKVSSKATGPGDIKSIIIVSNTDEGKNFNICKKGAPVEFKYYESIFQDVIYATVTYVDTGNSVDNKTAVEGLPITGSETVLLKFSDVNNVEIGGSPQLKLLINKVTEVMSDSGKTLVTLEMNSKEIFDNDKIRINTRFDGLISDHIEKILKKDEEYIGTEKEIDIEKTLGNYNKICNNKKPFYMMNWFSTIAAPEGKSGNSAGFLLWETSKGFHFKSIDWLFDAEKNKKKKSIIFTDTPDSGGSNIPEGYDIKALQFEKDNRNNIKDKLEQGAYSTRLITFNPFNCYYEVTYPNAGNNPKAQGEGEGKGNENNLELAGVNLPKLNPEIKTVKDGKNDFSRTTFKYLDVGSLPEGDGEGEEQEQITKSEKENAKPKEVLNQGIMRMNQMNNMMISITLPGDFTLHAGDSLFIDSPQLASGKKKDQQTEVDTQSGGLYIIRDLCHYMTSKETYTRINVIRDSFGRKGTASDEIF